MEQVMEPIQRVSTNSQFTVRERLTILAEYENLHESGEKAAFRRRVGVSQSSVSRWAIEKRAGILIEKDGKQNKYMMKQRDRIEFERVKRENEMLRAKLAQSESVVEVLGKASALLEALAKSAQLSELPSETAQQIPPAFTRKRPGPSSGRP